MSYEVVWEQPAPGRARPRVDWEAHLSPLQEQPGKWARVAAYVGETSAYKVAQRLRTDSRFATGEWEFAARRHADGGSRLYARYTGRPRRPRRSGS